MSDGDSDPTQSDSLDNMASAIAKVGPTSREGDGSDLPFRMFTTDITALGPEFIPDDIHQKVIVRNLNGIADAEDVLRNLLRQYALEPVSISHPRRKDWFIIIEFANQMLCDRAIDVLDCCQLCGCVIAVEPVIPRRWTQRMSPNLMLQISGLPPDSSEHDLYPMLLAFGRLKYVKFIGDSSGSAVVAIFNNIGDAQRAATQLDGQYWFRGTKIVARLRPLPSLNEWYEPEDMSLSNTEDAYGIEY